MRKKLTKQELSQLNGLFEDTIMSAFVEDFQFQNEQLATAAIEYLIDRLQNLEPETIVQEEDE
jgi:hypothetical protein